MVGNASDARGGITIHLELRSPMFGDTCISNRCLNLRLVFHFASFFVRGVVKNEMCGE